MLLIDREMPTCCEDCFAQAEYYNPRFHETEYDCGINGKNLGSYSRQDCGGWHCDRPKWCPLKEQESKTGKWILDDEDANSWECSECGGLLLIDDGTPHENDWYFCPYCGSKLEEQVVK